MPTVKATLHGAVSIVNAIATGMGATLGISLEVEALIEAQPGKGIFFDNNESNLSARLIREVLETSFTRQGINQDKGQHDWSI